MPWVRIDENAMDHPKFVAISANAWRLWCEGQAYCQKHLTDGVIPRQVLKGFRYYSPASFKQLITVNVHGKGPLWHVQENGVIEVNDYLDWNDSRAQVLEGRMFQQIRVRLSRDPELRRSIRARDRDLCRYCGVKVNWSDRKGPTGATYDHVIPIRDGANDLSNLVIACRRCNSKKMNKTPEQAGMRLLPPANPSTDLDRISDSAPPFTSGVVCTGSEALETGESLRGGKPDTPPQRAGAFCEWYADTHERLFGVAYIGTNSDYLAALRMVEKVSNADLQDAALVWFGQDDDFATQGTRTIAKFASRATGCLQQARAVVGRSA